MIDSETVLIIDDDTEVGKIISEILNDEGYEAIYFSDGHSALEFLSTNKAAVIFLDLWFKNEEAAGFDIFNNIRKLDKHIPIVMISGHGNIDIAVKAIKLGAYDFIEKPFNLNKLLLTTARAVEISKLRKENQILKSISDFNTYIIGNSLEMTKVRGLLKKSAASNSRIFITANPGSGAEIIAEYIHENSQRSNKSFNLIDCSILNEEECDTALFGTSSKPGTLENLDGGTLFLSNVDALCLNLQVKLLRFLQSGSYQPRDSNAVKKADVRIISSCIGKDLGLLTKEKKFKEDLLFRLSVVHLNLPPLSKRREDIPMIIDYLVKHSNDLFKLSLSSVDADVIHELCAYSWPGNVRQLQNVIEVAGIMASNGVISSENLPNDLLSSITPEEIADVSKLLTLPLKEAREIFERNYISMQIDRFSGNISQVANFIGMERSALHRKLKSLDISSMRNRSINE